MVPVRHPDALAKWRILGLSMEQLAYRVIGCLRLISSCALDLPKCYTGTKTLRRMLSAKFLCHASS